MFAMKRITCICYDRCYNSTEMLAESQVPTTDVSGAQKEAKEEKGDYKGLCYCSAHRSRREEAPVSARGQGFGASLLLLDAASSS